MKVRRVPIPDSAKAKLPQECIDDFETGNCGVYVITGPNFGDEFITDKKGKFDIAKYGMTCNLGGVRPNKQIHLMLNMRFKSVQIQFRQA